MANTFYNRIIRKLVVGFGDLFSNITLVRFNPDETEQSRFIVPIDYAAKELYVQRLQYDYNLDKKVQITLPRLSYSMDGFSYDSTRKQNTNIKNFASTSNGIISQYNPVPYNFDFNLYIYVRHIEDGHQILEHVLSYFTPDFTIKLNLIPEMGIIKEIPIVLNHTQQDIQYEGNRDSETRMVVWTLNFTVKGFIFGSTSSAGLIKHSITNVYNEISPDQEITFNLGSGSGVYKIGEVVYHGYSRDLSSATAIVVGQKNNTLTLKNINGNFVSSLPIKGITSNANYSFTSYNVHPVKYVEIDIVPDPPTANASDNYTYNTTITEYQ